MNKFILAFISLVFAVHGLGQSKTVPGPKSLTNKIENYLEKLERVGFSGSVLVELNGEKIISKGYGHRNIVQDLKNTPETIFDIGSITKQFTAAAIMRLEMDGKLKTSDKLTKYFDDVPIAAADVTIHDLLRHSSGFQGGVGGDYESISEDEFVKKALNSPLRFPSGTRFSYSNIGYSLLAMIVEKASGKTYETYLFEELWKPVGMFSTGYVRPDFSGDLIAVGYRNKEVWGKPNEKAWAADGPFWHLKGNGGILSTVEDLYKWHKALLGDAILSADAKKKYYHPELRPDEHPNPYYGYGWDMFKTKRSTMVARHNGSNRIFYADFHRFLDEGTAIISLSNRANPNFTAINREIGKIIFEKDYEPTIPAEDSDANRAFTTKIIDLTVEKGFETAWKAYRKRPAKLDLLEFVVNSKGYELIDGKNFRKAIDVLKLNTSAFPGSANAFDSLGEAYLESGNEPLALVNFRKSLELDPENTYAENVIKRLSAK